MCKLANFEVVVVGEEASSSSSGLVQCSYDQYELPDDLFQPAGMRLDEMAARFDSINKLNEESTGAVLIDRLVQHDQVTANCLKSIFRREGQVNWPVFNQMERVLLCKLIVGLYCSPEADWETTPELKLPCEIHMKTLTNLIVQMQPFVKEQSFKIDPLSFSPGHQIKCLQVYMKMQEETIEGFPVAQIKRAVNLLKSSESDENLTAVFCTKFNSADSERMNCLLEMAKTFCCDDPSINDLYFDDSMDKENSGVDLDSKFNRRKNIKPTRFGLQNK